MKIIVSQQDKKISVSFIHKDVVDKFVIAKAEDFLGVVDRFVKKRKISFIGQTGRIEFKNTGILTERVVRAIMLGLKFSYFKQN